MATLVMAMATPVGCASIRVCRVAQNGCDLNQSLAHVSNGGPLFAEYSQDLASPIKVVFGPGPQPCGDPIPVGPGHILKLEYEFNNVDNIAELPMPCFNEPPYNFVLYVGLDGATFWDDELSDPAGLK